MSDDNTTVSIEIEKKTLDYLNDVLHKDGAEAWYTGQIRLDLEDYNGAIKSMANSLAFERALANDRLDYNPPFDEGIRREKDAV